LVYMHEPWTKPIVTIENYCKWYDLYLVHPDGRVEAVPFPEERIEGAPYLDHAPNPSHVLHWAERMGYHLHEESEEMMIGRWEIEYHDRERYPWPEEE
jgi:hypothetical protein